MCRFILALLVSSLFSVTLTLGMQQDEGRLHWLSLSSPSDLTNEEKEKLNHLEFVWKMLDNDDDGRLSMEEIVDKAEFLSMGKEVPSIGYDELKYLLCGHPPLMDDSVFEDMWWIMSHDVQSDLHDYTDIFFKYVDYNGDDFMDKDELEMLLITGGRTKHSPTQKTEYHVLFETLDQNGSGGLDYSEMWNPIVMLIKSQPKEEISTGAFAEVVQGYSKLSPRLLDCKKLAMCVDSDNDGFITLKDKGMDFASILDKNYSDVVEEHEMKDIPKELDRCADSGKSKVKDKEEL